MQLTLRSLTVLSPDEVAITLTDDAGDEVTFRFSLTDAHGIWVVNGEPAFSEQYRLVPGPSLPMWPEQLAMAALKAVREPLPDAETLALLDAEVREELNRRWPHTASELTTQDTRSGFMPLESLSCSHCGSGDVQQVKPDTYFCNHCDSLFKYVNSGQMAGGVGCELTLPTGKTCGVPPIGRCVTCYRTFCATHYGENLISPTNARGCCLECAIKAENARLEHEIRFGQSYLVNSARDALKSAGVAPVQIYSRRTENQVRSFGRSRFVDYLDPWATGWIIGTFPWKYREGPYGGTEVERECLTALIDDTARSSIFNYYFSTDRNLARISKGPDRDVFVVAQSGGFIRSPYDEISRTIHRMTE